MTDHPLHTGSAQFFKSTMQYLALVKLFHFQTPWYSAHKASDWIYEQVNDIMDKILEAWQGITDRIPPVAFSMQIRTLTDEEMLQTTRNYLQVASQYERLWTQAFEQEVSTGDDIANQLQDLKAHLHKFIYLLSFE